MSSYGTNGTKQRDNGRPRGGTIGTGQALYIRAVRPCPMVRRKTEPMGLVPMVARKTNERLSTSARPTRRRATAEPWPPAEYRLPDTIEEIERGRIVQGGLFPEPVDDTRNGRTQRLLGQGGLETGHTPQGLR